MGDAVNITASAIASGVMLPCHSSTMDSQAESLGDLRLSRRASCETDVSDLATNIDHYLYGR